MLVELLDLAGTYWPCWDFLTLLNVGGIYWRWWGLLTLPGLLDLAGWASWCWWDILTLMGLLNFGGTSWPGWTPWHCLMDFLILVEHLDVGGTSWLWRNFLTCLDFLTLLRLLNNWCNTHKLYCLYTPINSHFIFNISNVNIQISTVKFSKFKCNIFFLAFLVFILHEQQDIWFKTELLPSPISMVNFHISNVIFQISIFMFHISSIIFQIWK